MYSHYQRQPAPQKRKKHRLRHLLIALILFGGIGFFGWHAWKNNKPVHAATRVITSQSTASTKQVQAATTPCAGNTVSKLIIVSISKRHLWACSTSTQQYDSAVVTGMENIPADLTPTGTYQIYGKQTNLYLDGSDSTGSWHDYVSYWMPFLHNQYGTYGFHDATWRANTDFGNIDPYSSQGSHGCVELPLATAKWIYNWAENGATVTIIS
jgi:hypothetical protein